jgi:hypothetical protein
VAAIRFFKRRPLYLLNHGESRLRVCIDLKNKRKIVTDNQDVCDVRGL